MSHSGSTVDIEWRIDDNGLLRCTADIMRTGIFTYTLGELREWNVDGIPDGSDEQTVDLYVSPDTLNNERSLASLEGKGVTVGHVWQTADGRTRRVGAVAGKPFVVAGGDGEDRLRTDFLIDDGEVIERITNSDLVDTYKLSEDSAAYTMDVLWGAGLTPTGVHYDGIQSEMDYNHVALLPPGMGRAGPTVRILNSKQNMSNITPGNVDEKVVAIDDAVNETPTTENSINDPSLLQIKLDAALAEIAELRAKINGGSTMNADARSTPEIKESERFDDFELSRPSGDREDKRSDEKIRAGERFDEGELKRRGESHNDMDRGYADDEMANLRAENEQLKRDLAAATDSEMLDTMLNERSTEENMQNSILNSLKIERDGKTEYGVSAKIKIINCAREARSLNALTDEQTKDPKLLAFAFQSEFEHATATNRVENSKSETTSSGTQYRYQGQFKNGATKTVKVLNSNTNSLIVELDTENKTLVGGWSAQDKIDAKMKKAKSRAHDRRQQS